MSERRMKLQALVDAMNEASRAERSRYHVTLGKLIEVLAAADPDMPVIFDDDTSPCKPHSYRGYYSDLSFAGCNEPKPAGDLLAQCRVALGATFEGYKCGDFVMGDDTPLWRASWGHTGDAIVGVTVVAGKLLLETKQLD